MTTPSPSCTEPLIEVGILSAPEIRFRLHGRFRHPECLHPCTGEGSFRKTDDGILLELNGQSFPITDGFQLSPESADAFFELQGVIIGIHFHWERAEDQAFPGILRCITEGELLTAVNVLPLERYLASVISSEMKATAPAALLKAHAVISRSWLLAQKEKARHKAAHSEPDEKVAGWENDGELIRWWDRQDHARFDVCADDHCQRYQGIGKPLLESAAEAVRQTRGEVLSYQGSICDTRYSKCCGGMTEHFENVWEETPHPYLQALEDREAGEAAAAPPDLTTAAGAHLWIDSRPQAFCDTSDREILASVLNDFDTETTDFYRWTVSYGADELSELVSRKLKREMGRLLDIEPLERGPSGRIVRIRITGTRRSLVIGKELLIRQAFSPSHLYSSAFTVSCQRDGAGNPLRFTFRGAGWGHGVGLCQIGAAVMSHRGYSYREILAHYFPHARIEKNY